MEMKSNKIKRMLFYGKSNRIILGIDFVFTNWLMPGGFNKTATINFTILEG